MMMKPYFPARGGDPPPLRVSIKRKVRFEEVDSLGIVWHGRYPSFIEDVRDALGDKYGISYVDFYSHGVVVPIRKMHIDYFHPLRLRDIAALEGILHWSEAARINFEFVIKNEKGRMTTSGYTVQMMLDMEDNILMVPPSFYKEFLEKWKKGEF